MNEFKPTRVWLIETDSPADFKIIEGRMGKDRTYNVRELVQCYRCNKYTSPRYYRYRGFCHLLGCEKLEHEYCIWGKERQHPEDYPHSYGAYRPQ